MTRQHKKHIKINSPKRSLRKDYKKYYANNTKTEKVTAIKQKNIR